MQPHIRFNYVFPRFHPDLYNYGDRIIVQVASGRFGVYRDYLDMGAAPQVIRDHLGIPIEVAIAVVDERLRREGIREQVSLIASGGIRSAADVAKAIALETP